MASGIYAITNTVTGEQYIGSSTEIAVRWRSHRSHLRAGRSPHTALQAAWNEYGEDAFLFTILEEVEDFELLAEREQHHIDERARATFSSGYNVRRGGIGGHNRLVVVDGRITSVYAVRRAMEEKLQRDRRPA